MTNYWLVAKNRQLLLVTVEPPNPIAGPWVGVTTATKTFPPKEAVKAKKAYQEAHPDQFAPKRVYKSVYNMGRPRGDGVMRLVPTEIDLTQKPRVIKRLATFL